MAEKKLNLNGDIIHEVISFIPPDVTCLIKHDQVNMTLKGDEIMFEANCNIGKMIYLLKKWIEEKGYLTKIVGNSNISIYWGKRNVDNGFPNERHYNKNEIEAISIVCNDIFNKEKGKKCQDM